MVTTFPSSFGSKHNFVFDFYLPKYQNIILVFFCRHIGSYCVDGRTISSLHKLMIWRNLGVCSMNDIKRHTAASLTDVAYLDDSSNP